MKGLSKQKRLRLTLATSLFVILTIPLAVASLLNFEDFDPTGEAALKEAANICSIRFLFVAPDTVQQGATVQLEISATAPLLNDGNPDNIVSTAVEARSQEIFATSYSPGEAAINERFTYTPEATGSELILGSVETTSGKSYTCKLDESKNSLASILPVNNAPFFSTDPKDDAEPSNAIKENDSYKYVMVAEDPDGDNIEYSYSFTPQADWLKMSVQKDGSNGSLQLTFSGVADQPASYLANVFIHDGYNEHLRSQSWTISVDPASNDNPVVTVSEPSSSSTVSQGENVTVRWSGTDQNQILGYKLYYAQNPGNSENWSLVDDSISHRTNSYQLSTDEIAPGTYKAIVQALDNQDPAGVGTGVSPASFTVKAPGSQPPVPDDDEEDPDGEDGDTDDGVIIQQPQIVNINPGDNSVITNTRKSISATLIAGTEATISTESIILEFDDQDLTAELEISEISESEVTVIYKPEEDLEAGEHQVKIEFEDSNADTTTREWSFTIESDESDSDSFNIFGFSIPKRTAVIIGAGIGVLLFALLIPWLLYLAWRNSDDKDDTLYPAPPTTPIKPMASYSPKQESRKDTMPRFNIFNKGTVKDTEKEKHTTQKPDKENNDSSAEKNKESSQQMTAMWTPSLNVSDDDDSQKEEERADEKTKDQSMYTQGISSIKPPISQDLAQTEEKTAEPTQPAPTIAEPSPEPVADSQPVPAKQTEPIQSQSAILEPATEPMVKTEAKSVQPEPSQNVPNPVTPQAEPTEYKPYQPVVEPAVSDPVQDTTATPISEPTSPSSLVQPSNQPAENPAPSTDDSLSTKRAEEEEKRIRELEDLAAQLKQSGENSGPVMRPPGQNGADSQTSADNQAG